MIRRLARNLRQRIRAFNNLGIILVYHRVTHLTSDPQLLSVTPAHFAEHLEVLRKHFNPVSLAELTGETSQWNLKPKSVAITFDDGYADNYLEATPLLEQFEVPATIFVVSGCLDSQHEFWWDDLERLLLQSGTLPPELRLEVSGANLCWPLDQDGVQERNHDSWNVQIHENPTKRHQIYRALHSTMRTITKTERISILDQLHTLTSPEPCQRFSHRTLSEEELISLSKQQRIEIGAHSITHPVLSTLNRQDQKEEIVGSKTRLEQLIGRTITSFAYPYGGAADYDQTTLDTVRAAGFHRACSNFPGAIRKTTDHFQLPRFIVRDYGGEEFQIRLREWLGA